MTEKKYNAADAARILEITRARVGQLIATGQLRATALTDKRILRYEIDADSIIERLLLARTWRPAQPRRRKVKRTRAATRTTPAAESALVIETKSDYDVLEAPSL